MARRRVLFFLLLLSSCLLSLQLPCCSGEPTVHDDSNPAQASNPTMPITVPSTNPAPTIITVPSTKPTITIPSLNPLPTPITAPSTNPSSTTPVPVTYPLPTPSTSTPAAPVTTPSASLPSAPLTNPATNPATPPAPNPVSAGRQTWCVARSGSTEAALQNALDYACGIGGADCSLIQPLGSCYYPNTLGAHASYAFNSYYRRNPAPSSCDFGGTAMLVDADPSSGSCVLLASSLSSPSSSSTAPTTQYASPVTAASGSDSGSSVLNAASGSGSSGSSDIPSTGNGWRSISSPLCWWWPWTAFFSQLLATAYMNGKF